MNNKITVLFWCFVALNGAAFVALSAYASHAQALNNTPYLLSVYTKASLQHGLHTIVLLVLTVTSILLSCRWVLVSMLFFAIGIIFFSYPLYLFSLTGVKIAAFLTPIGGVCFILGWLALVPLSWLAKHRGERVNE